MRKITLSIISAYILLACNLTIAKDLPAMDEQYYFNQTLSFEPSVVKPIDILGNPIGQWHLRPDQSVNYFKALAQSSDKVLFKEIGRSHENRPLITAYISSKENIARLEQIKAQRQDLKNYSGPNIVWLGYSVHGNEASGANAALMVAYRLAASKEPWIKELLEKTIVMIDPMLNPDGMGRFAQWVNSYKGQNLVADANSTEHNEAWPSGRMNHYWFDLNRDWLLLQQPESQARVKHFYQWRPHVVGDFHEMGRHSTYFFQPGVPSRQNPLTLQANFDLTNDIAKFHAAELDELGSSYYSKESFDDFYYGKGSTFPDINGGIGILYEQASARGHLQESINGEISFPFAIRNHIATSFSTLKGALHHDKTLSNYQKKFFSKLGDKISRDSNKGIIFSSSDQARLDEMLRLLKSHQIEVKQLETAAKINKKAYPANKSYVLSFNQQQYHLIQTMFEQRTKFENNTFYDISAWTMPLALNLQYSYLNKSEFKSLQLKGIVSQKIHHPIPKNALAVLIPWDNLNAAKGLNLLLKQGLKVKFAQKPFSSRVKGEKHDFEAGTLVITTKNQFIDATEVIELVEKVFNDLAVKSYATDSGFSLAGIDLGSPSMLQIKTPKPLLLIGEGVSPYEAGEVWHLLDTRLDIPLAMQPASSLGKIELNDYTHLLMVNGHYPKLEDKQREGLLSWVENGGNLVASRGAIAWLIKNKISHFSLLEKEEAKKPKNQSENKEKKNVKENPASFSERDDIYAQGIIGGAIYKTLLDNSNPMAYGIDLSYMPVTKSGTQVLVAPKEDFVTVATYAEKPLMAGYSSQKNQDKIKNSPAILAKRQGRGTIIMFNDNPLFRGYWLGSARAYINSLFFNEAL